METGLPSKAHPARAVLALAWPVFLEQILVTLVQYVDTAMVGSLGAGATAAIALNQSPIDLINGLILGLGVGITALLSRYVGAGEGALIQRLLRQILLLILWVGGGLTLLFLPLSPLIPRWMGAEPALLPDAGAYLFIISASLLFKTASVLLTAVYRGFGDTLTPLKVNLLVNLVNVAGNFFLIYPSRTLSLLGMSLPLWGAGFGVAGAALSTSLSTVLGGLLLFSTIRSHRGNIQLYLTEPFSPDPPLLKNTLSVGLPTILERLVMSLGKIVITAAVAGLGTVPLAAHYLVVTGESLSFMPSFAFSVAATTLVGQSLGAGDLPKAKSYSRTTLSLSILVMTAAGFLLYLGAEPLTSLFSNDPAVVALATRCLRLTAFLQPIQVISVVVTGILRGAGDAKWPFYIVLISMWSVRILLSLIAIHLLGLGLFAVWVAICLDVLTRAILFALRYRSGRWLHPLTSTPA